MSISVKELEEAVSKSIITKEQFEKLKKEYSLSESKKTRFTFLNVFYYFGGLLIISSMTWFIRLGWESFGGFGIFTIALAYIFALLFLAQFLWSKKDFKIPGGLLYTAAVCIVPLVIYGLQRGTGFWAFGDPGKYQDIFVWIKGSWILMEIGTIAAALVVLRSIKFTFLAAPISFALWFMSMDLVPVLFRTTHYSWDDRQLVSFIFGILMILVSFILDRRTKEDYSFWLYIFGAFAFWGGLSLFGSTSEIEKAIYGMINIFMIILSVWLERKIFIILGAVGVFSYLSSLSYRLFADSVMFPLVVSFMGLSIIFLAVYYQKNKDAFDKLVLSIIPSSINRLQPKNRVFKK
jgi:hypothetical protein